MLTRCPECGAAYLYERVTERDITYEDVTTRLARLSDAELPAHLQPPEREAFAAQIPARLERRRATLEHPAEWLRREAAWHLAAIGRADGRWDDHLLLLGHVDADVRHEVATLLGDDPAIGDAPEAIASALAALREDGRAATRGCAARALTTWRLAHGQAKLAVDELLRDADPSRAAAVLLALRRTPTPDVVAESVRTLALLYREEAVRDGVAWLLRETASLGASEKIIPGLLDFLRDDDEETANVALLVFEVIRVRCDALVPILPRWCTNPKTQFRAYVLLQEQARLGTDLTPLLPMLGDRLERLKEHEPAATASVLLAMLPHAADPLPVARELLRGVPGRWDTSILTSIDRVAASGADLRALEPRVRTLLEEAVGAKREFIAGWLRQLHGHVTATR